MKSNFQNSEATHELFQKLGRLRQKIAFPQTGKYNAIVNFRNVRAVNQVLDRLNNLRRWVSFVSEAKYNELAKQALNCITAYMLASYSEQAGLRIHWERFPKIALYRVFQKAYVYYSVQEKNMSRICEVGGERTTKQFKPTIKEMIEELTDKEFVSFISEANETYEMRIYRAATKIATLIELVDIQSVKKIDKYDVHQQQIFEYLEQFSDIPGVNEMKDINGKVFQVIREISELRNQNRWAGMFYQVDCPVLGHLFDTAIFGYFMALEKEYEPMLAAKIFFMLIFHDIAEVWTQDIPSPIKDRIPGFREASEVYELEMLEENLYSHLPEFLVPKIKQVMMEEERNARFKKLLKGADYLAADAECYRQYLAGSRHKKFLDVIQGFQKKLKQGSAVLTPTCMELHRHFLRYAKKLDNLDE